MGSYKIDNRYAQALFDSALENDILETVYEEMNAIAVFSAEDKQLSLVLKNPIIPISKKEKIVREIFKDKLHTLTLTFWIFLIHKRRVINLKGISVAFVELYKLYKNIQTVLLTTADEVSQEEIKSAIIAKLTQSTGKTIDLKTQIKPELLGGFRLSYGDYLYDASISTHIQKLKREFLINPYERKA